MKYYINSPTENIIVFIVLFIIIFLVIYIIYNIYYNKIDTTNNI